MCRTVWLANVFVVVAFLGGAGATRSCAGHPAECRDGTCDPHCPVRPGQFGYYQTHWRRWPGGDAPGDASPPESRNNAIPVLPGRSVVPGADEESPPSPPEPLAPGGGAAGAGPVGAADEDRIARLVAAADAARLADAASRARFTVELVGAMLSEPDPRDRCTVLGLAAAFDTPDAEAVCAGALEDPDPRVRLVACQVCADRRPPDGVARLARRAREDGDLGVRLRAVRALGDLGDPAVVPHLVALLDDPDPAIQVRATAALGRATGRNFGTDVERWRAWAANPPPARRWSSMAALRDLF